MGWILITNDDGVDSPALVPLARAINQVGRVEVVVPDRERSWIGKAITRHDPVTVRPVVRGGSTFIAASGYPADCVQLGLHALFAEPPALVVSGINIGYNHGSGYIHSSGTVGAAVEAVLGNVPAIALAAGGLDRVYGTNPIAFGAPIEGENPFLLDIATTAVAGGKLEIAMRQGKKIPEGWAAQGDGSPSDDPEILRKGGALLPLGSQMRTSSYKGYGLGLMVDILTGILPGSSSALFSDRAKLEQGYWFAAWRIDAFRDPDEFRAEMKRMAAHVRATRPEPGVERVMIAGDPEWIARADRERHGIPLDAESIEQLTQLGEEVGVPFPAAVPG